MIVTLIIDYSPGKRAGTTVWTPAKQQLKSTFLLNMDQRTSKIKTFYIFTAVLVQRTYLQPRPDVAGSKAAAPLSPGRANPEHPAARRANCQFISVAQRGRSSARLTVSGYDSLTGRNRKDEQPQMLDETRGEFSPDASKRNMCTCGKCRLGIWNVVALIYSYFTV